MSTTELRAPGARGVSPNTEGQDPYERGRAEVRLCREDPARRMSSPLGELTAGPGWRVAVRLTRIRFPRAARMVLGGCGWIASGMVKLPGGRGLGRRIMGARDTFAFFCGAIQEAGGWEAFRLEFAMRLPVLCYHHVGEKLAGSWPLMTVSPKVFQRQVKWLAERGYTGIHAADWLAWLRQGKALPDKPVLVTFDDGYSDLLANAIPVLEKHGFKATIFIVSQRIGGASSWDVALGHPSRPLMTASQVQECPKHGIEIGAHSRTHPDLRTLQDAELKSELEGCREELTDLMGKPVNTLAYCFGFQNEQVRVCAGKIYDLAFSGKPGLNAWRSDPYCLRRLFVHPNRINFGLQMKYGIDLHAVYRFVLRKAGGVFQRVLPLPGRVERQTSAAVSSSGTAPDSNA